MFQTYENAGCDSELGATGLSSMQMSWVLSYFTCVADQRSYQSRIFKYNIKELLCQGGKKCVNFEIKTTNVLPKNI